MSNEMFGSSFDELSQDEMDFITGATGGAQPLATQALSPVVSGIAAASSAKCIAGGVSVILSAASGLISYTKKCI